MYFLVPLLWPLVIFPPLFRVVWYMFIINGGQYIIIQFLILSWLSLKLRNIFCIRITLVRNTSYIVIPLPHIQLNEISVLYDILSDAVIFCILPHFSVLCII